MELNIKQLIQSTSMVKGRSRASTFQKKFGTILLYNQTVTVRRFGTVIDVSMMISGVTDMIKTANGRKPVAYHKVTMSIKGIKQQYYTPQELIDYIRLNHREFADEKAYPNPDVLKYVLENPDKIFSGSTVFRATNDAGKGFCVVSNKIPEDSEVQVWCSCSDYYWTWQYYNCDNEVDIYGKYPERYTPKTKRGFEAMRKNQPLRNPTKKPGMCKHLMLLLATLMEKGVVQKGKSGLVGYYQANFSKFKTNKRLGKDAYENRIAKWQKDQDIKVAQRKIESKATGYASEKGYKTKSWGWNSKTHKFKGY